MALYLSSRKKLNYPEFEVTRDKVFVGLQKPYSDFFRSQFQHLEHKRVGPWGKSSSGVTERVVFERLSRAEIILVQQFIEVYKQMIFLAPNSYTKDFVSNELDTAVSFEYTFREEDSGARQRTETWQHLYLAKYNANAASLLWLKKRLVDRLPYLPEWMSGEFDLTFVPCERTKQVHLPKEVAIHASHSVSDNKVRYITTNLLCDKPQIKDSDLRRKNRFWKAVCERRLIELSENVSGRSVILIDDIYQSGLTLWRVGGYLKDCGAREVIGVTFVKTWRDDQNS